MMLLFMQTIFARERRRERSGHGRSLFCPKWAGNGEKVCAVIRINEKRREEEVCDMIRIECDIEGLIYQRTIAKLL